MERLSYHREVKYEEVHVVGGGAAGVQHDHLGVWHQHELLQYVDAGVAADELEHPHAAVAKPDPEPYSMDVDEPVGQLQSVRVLGPMPLLLVPVAMRGHRLAVADGR